MKRALFVWNYGLPKDSNAEIRISGCVKNYEQKKHANFYRFWIIRSAETFFFWLLRGPVLQNYMWHTYVSGISFCPPPLQNILQNIFELLSGMIKRFLFLQNKKVFFIVDFREVMQKYVTYSVGAICFMFYLTGKKIFIDVESSMKSDLMTCFTPRIDSHSS